MLVFRVQLHEYLDALSLNRTGLQLSPPHLSLETLEDPHHSLDPLQLNDCPWSWLWGQLPPNIIHGVFRRCKGDKKPTSSHHSTALLYICSCPLSHCHPTVCIKRETEARRRYGLWDPCDCPLRRFTIRTSD